MSVDSANYEPTFDTALGLVEYDKLRAEQRDRRERGDTKQLGIGLSTYIEMCGLAPSNILGALRYAAGGWDGATIECLPTGKVLVKTGTSPHGQGHETAWAQIVADGLGVTPDDIEVLHGDTLITPLGMDTYGSRSVSVGGVALHFAMEKIKAKARTIAAHELEVAEDDLEWGDGAFHVEGAPDKAKTIPELAFSAWHAHALPEGTEPHLNATAVYDPPNFTWPAGAHICVVEVDTETGATEIVKYVAVDDCGTVINPMIVDGQIHGGVAQGVAEALYEEAIYDESGNLTTSTMTQYLIPTAVEIPTMTTDGSHQTPSTTNPLGVKGIGEAGTIAAPPAVLNAVIDAVSHLGVTAIEKPASPERVWRAIQEAKARRCGMIPAQFEYERVGLGRCRDRGAAGRRGREAAGRGALAPAADEAPVRDADEADRHRTAPRPVLRPRGRRRRRHRGAHPLSRPGGVGGAPAALLRSWPPPPARSATRRSGTWGRSAARSRTPTRPATCPRCCSRSARRSWHGARRRCARSRPPTCSRGCSSRRSRTTRC